jgi:hypothetical protein
MKKIIMLLATAILLYGAPNVYAETKIHPGMSVDEIIAVLEEHGLLDQIDTPVSVEKEDATTPSTNTDQSQSLNYTVDNSNPVHTDGPCTPPPSPSFSVTGADMGNIMGTFPVTATGMPFITNTVNWVALPSTPPLPQAGVAVGNGWMLLENGDTWNNNWWIITQTGVFVTSIKIDAWHNGGNIKHAVFDIINGPEVTPGSANGLAFNRGSPATWTNFSGAVYSTPVLLGAGPVPAGHDLYGTLTINFLNGNGFSGAAPLGGFLMFKADTDCMPVQEVLLNSYDGITLNFTVLGEGAVAITTDGSVVQGPFIVERGEGQNTFITQFTPKANSCYVMTDIDTGTVMTDKYCF